MSTSISYPIKTGLVGLGVLSQTSLLPHFVVPDSKEKLDLVSVCDIDKKRAQITAKSFKIPEYYNNLEDMLRNAAIDAVLVCTPSPTLYEVALTALRAGKHVYVQKTFANRLEDAQEIIEEARHRDLVFVASPEQMLNPARQAARQMITDGVIGPVYWGLCVTDNPGPQFEEGRLGEGDLDKIDPSWWFKADAGPVFNMSVYSLHSITGLLGPVERVCAFSGQRVKNRAWKDKQIIVEVDDNTLMLLDFGGGVFALVSGCTAHPGKSVNWGHLSIFGARGALEIYSTIPGEPNFANVVDHIGGETYQFDDFRPYIPKEHTQINFPFIYADIMHFLDCIASGTRPYNFGDQACHVVEVIEKAYLAARSGEVQRINSGFDMEF